MVDISQLLEEATSGELSVPALPDQIIGASWRVEGRTVMSGEVAVAAVCSPEIAQHIVREHNIARASRLFAHIPHFTYELLCKWLQETVSRFSLSLKPSADPVYDFHIEILVYSIEDRQRVQAMVDSRVPLGYPVRVLVNSPVMVLDA